MPLSHRDRKFLERISQLKLYLLLMAIGVFVFLLVIPSNEIQMATSVIGLALCGVFWLTQRLLSFITQLDAELSRVVNTLKHTLTPDQQKELLGSD